MQAASQTPNQGKPPLHVIVFGNGDPELRILLAFGIVEQKIASLAKVNIFLDDSRLSKSGKFRAKTNECMNAIKERMVEQKVQHLQLIEEKCHADIIISYRKKMIDGEMSLLVRWHRTKRSERILLQGKRTMDTSRAKQFPWEALPKPDPGMNISEDVCHILFAPGFIRFCTILLYFKSKVLLSS